MFVLLICLRMPDVVLHGRLWAEEGNLFYIRTATEPAATALFAPYGGYLNLVANAAPVLARALVPLELVPRVTIAIGLAFQCVPAALLIWSRDAWLRPLPIRLACVLLLALPVAAEEVWLQTLHAQFQLAVGAALILALDVPASTGGRAARFVVLALGPLCGPAAIALCPLFLLRGSVDRSGPRLVQAAVLIAASSAQLLFFFHGSEMARGQGTSLTLAACAFTVKLVMLPFLGRFRASTLAAGLLGRIASGQYPVRGVLVAVAAVGGYTILAVRRGLGAAAWLFASGMVIFGVAVYGSLSSGTSMLVVGESGRYSFMPQVLLALSLAAVAAGRDWAGWLARAAVAWLIVFGLIDLPRTSMVMASGPSWQDEVRAWRADPSHPIAIWPRGWTMQLDHE